MRALRKVTNSYPGNRVLIGETYLPDIAELRKWYGADHDELQLPMDMQVGFLNKLDAAAFRTRIDQAEHDIDHDQPLFVFDNHDNARSWNRYGDGEHNLDIARVIATLLLGTRATAMMYYGEELGMTTTPHAGRGCEGPRSARSAGQRKRAATASARRCSGMARPTPVLPRLRPRPGCRCRRPYKTVNVAIESREDDSLLSWYQQTDTVAPRQPGVTRRHLDHAECKRQQRSVMVTKKPDGQVCSYRL